MDENTETNQPAATDAAKEAAMNLKAEAEQAVNEIKGRGIMGFFSFDKLYFPLVARYVFIAMCILIAIGMVLGVVGGLIGMIRVNVFAGIGTIIGSIIGSIIGLVLTRIWFEMFLVAFKMNENLEKIRDK